MTKAEQELRNQWQGKSLFCPGIGEWGGNQQTVRKVDSFVGLVRCVLIWIASLSDTVSMKKKNGKTLKLWTKKWVPEGAHRVWGMVGKSLGKLTIVQLGWWTRRARRILFYTLEQWQDGGGQLGWVRLGQIWGLKNDSLGGSEEARIRKTIV